MTIEALQDRMLSALRPDHVSEPPTKWQQRKSAKMRERLVSTAVDCLLEHGYTGLTTAAVATRSGVSRGAMHHHFQTRMELVSAVVEHVVFERMRAYLSDYFDILAHRQGEAIIELACEAHWRSAQSREYAAYLELTVAARTDAELAAIFNPASRRLDEVWTGEMIEAFPQWKDHWDMLKLSHDFISAMHMGMVLHKPIYDGTGRMEVLRRFASHTIQELYDRR
ncbi:TetR/AcrR family transcriptional regulator [Novosphingobium sp. KN65.2]|uniref:TetR/AcrR family transcriptional regulator n=1 Tax=Novosphingobium sp. KN65.2 TaxID=1478134 RepID=UPI0005DDEEDA|nr:TetR/AcrR family transcriptional regulator [Novosphingobium sp. KN65.2]CDO38703.1 Transcriptional regulator, TetR family [Novosphingobium sp. KN65.2]